MNQSSQIASDAKPLSPAMPQSEANPLLEHYQPDASVYFASPARALLAQPPFASLLVTGTEDLSQQVKQSLRFAQELGLREPVVVGAIPFDTRQPSYLRVSNNCAFQSLPCQRPASNEQVGLGPCAIQAVPSGAHFKAGVSEALRRFARGELDKVVLSRTLEIQAENRPNVRALVKNLAAKNTRGYTFAVNLKPIDNQRKNRSVHTLVGASPELLLSRQGCTIFANPLAGSAARSSDPQVDQQRAMALLHSEKDRREHALVIKAIEQALRPYCRTLHIPAEPSLVSTPALWHLSTKIEGELLDPETTSLQLALALHPTPAVCGYPTAAARQAIKDIETHERGLFTGMVGWCNTAGDGEWVVTIRCAQVEDRKIRLYAGAGIVTGSTPESELAETGTKFNTMLHALGINPSANDLDDVVTSGSAVAEQNR